MKNMKMKKVRPMIFKFTEIQSVFIFSKFFHARRMKILWVASNLAVWEREAAKLVWPNVEKKILLKNIT